MKRGALVVKIAPLMLVLALCTALPGAAEVTEGPLQRLVNSALADNPHLRALRSRVDASQARMRQAGSLQDPMLSVGVSNTPVGGFALDDTPMSGIQIGLRQKIPYPGKLDLRELAAREKVAITEAMVQEAEKSIARGVKHNYYTLGYLHRAIEITKMNKSLAEATAKVAEVKYSVGMAPQQDLVKANVAVARYVDRLVVLTERLSNTRASLNALLDRPPDGPLPHSELDYEPLELSEAALMDVAKSERPLILQDDGRIRRAQTMLRLAERGKKPDFDVGVGYRIRSGSDMDPVNGADFWSFSVKGNLPWLNEDLHDAEIDEAQAALTEAKRARQETVRRVREALSHALASVRKNSRQVTLYSEGLIPEAELAFSTAQTAYETGQVDLLNVLDALQTLDEHQTAYYRAVSDHAKAVANLEYAIGHTLR